MCAWNALSNRAWLQPYPLSGAGNGVVSFTVFPNFSGSQRTGAITIGDKHFTVTQQAGTGTADSRFIRLLYFNLDVFPPVRRSLSNSGPVTRGSNSR